MLAVLLPVAGSVELVELFAPAPAPSVPELLVWAELALDAPVPLLPEALVV